MDCNDASVESASHFARSGEKEEKFFAKARLSRFGAGRMESTVGNLPCHAISPKTADFPSLEATPADARQAPDFGRAPEASRSRSTSPNAQVRACRGQARVDKGLTIRQAALKLGVHYRTVVVWESGKYRPTPRHLGAIKAFLGDDPPKIYRKTPKGTTVGNLPTIRRAHQTP